MGNYLLKINQDQKVEQIIHLTYPQNLITYLIQAKDP